MGYRRLTGQELEDLRNEMQEAGAWMKAELERRKERNKYQANQEEEPEPDPSYLSPA